MIVSVVAGILLTAFILMAIFAVGWYVVAPPFAWLGDKVLSLAIKGAEYRMIVKCRQPCCGCDNGRDASSPETGGRCWDCYGTGHVHPL